MFTCQHGNIECVNNLYQACLLNKVKDQKIQLELVQCLMGSNNPYSTALDCMRNIVGKENYSVY